MQRMRSQMRGILALALLLLLLASLRYYLKLG
jgi:hypothetical protein